MLVLLQQVAAKCGALLRDQRRPTPRLAPLWATAANSGRVSCQGPSGGHLAIGGRLRRADAQGGGAAALGTQRTPRPPRAPARQTAN